MDISKGRYWDKPWSLVDGCTPCSPGCDHCWSAAMTHRFNFQWTKDGKAEFNGHIVTHPDRLSIPMKRRKPTVYAVWNDLYHESVPFEFIKEVHFQIGIMDLHQYGHTFLVLTKRPQRLLEKTFWEDGCTLPDGSHDYDSGTEPMHKLLARPTNLWFGLTICNQQEADEKIPIFLQVPGKKFLSIEPMLGEIDIGIWLQPPIGDHCCPRCGFIPIEGMDEYRRIHVSAHGKAKCISCELDISKEYDKINAVILGGETGPGARPMHPDWVRSVRDQCAAAGVPFFLKSGMGKRKTYWSDELTDWGNFVPELWSCLEDGHIGTFQPWRMLDGRTHDDLPWRAKP